jgi:hypothetical protein
VLRFDEIENASTAEFGSELRGLHPSLLFPEIIIADCGAAAPSKKFGTPVSEFTATVGDAGAGGGCGNTGGSNFRGADDGVTCRGPTRAIPLFRNACDGRRRADAGRRVV